MGTTRSDRNRIIKGVNAPAPRLTFSGAILLAAGVSASLMVAMTGFTFAITLIWPG